MWNMSALARQLGDASIHGMYEVYNKGQVSGTIQFAKPQFRRNSVHKVCLECGYNGEEHINENGILSCRNCNHEIGLNYVTEIRDYKNGDIYIPKNALSEKCSTLVSRYKSFAADEEVLRKWNLIYSTLFARRSELVTQHKIAGPSKAIYSYILANCILNKRTDLSILSKSTYRKNILDEHRINLCIQYFLISFIEYEQKAEDIYSRCKPRYLYLNDMLHEFFNDHKSFIHLCINQLGTEYREMMRSRQYIDKVTVKNYILMMCNKYGSSGMLANKQALQNTTRYKW